MSKLLLCFAFISSTLFAANIRAENFYDFKYVDTNKKEVKFSDFKGKTVMVVNIATRCGFTGQLDDIEKLYQKYKGKNFVVVGFPSNDFLGQSPESNEEIAKFCRLKYGATFPIVEKQVVKGDGITPLYKWLTTQKGYEGDIGWNFVKFIINKEGHVVGRFSSKIDPLDESVTKNIEKVL